MDTLKKIKTMSSATIDRKLKHEKEVLKFNLHYKKRKDYSLLSEVPTKTSIDLNRQVPGNIQVDCVEHCGASAAGEYINSLATVDIYSG
ncbi:MAG: hypothetical protein PHR98_01845 [Candidatus Shapirobacteria bacterium]|jgi:hypothetical protein|nr:hypothetical protein [Candidatus Shapirobacteria bacterium]